MNRKLLALMIVGVAMMLIVFALLLARCGKTPSPVVQKPIPSPTIAPKPSPTESPEPSVESQPQGPQARKKGKKGANEKGKLQVGAIPCPTPPAADWGNVTYYNPEQMKYRSGTVTSLTPCDFTVRFTEGDSATFSLSGLSDRLSLNADVQVQYWTVNNAVGFVRIADSSASIAATPQYIPHWPGEKIGTFTIPAGMMVLVTTNPEPRVKDGNYCATRIFTPCWRDVNGERWQFNQCFKPVGAGWESDLSCAYQKRP